jgi:exonuclease VII large subunit
MESYTVTELTDVIKQTLHKEFKNYQITVVGEISNFKTSGKHTFLTLKDDNTQINVAFWSSVLNNKHGDHVEVMGRIELYAKTGNINLIGSSIKMIGIGSLHTEYEKLKNEYNKKGYFNNKKPLPASIKKIGIITSEGGAALKDLLYVLEQNEFAGDVYIYDCIAQGIRCPASVAAGIKFFNSPFYPVNNDNNQQIENSNEVSNSVHNMSNDSDSDASFDPFATSASVKSKNTNNKDTVKTINKTTKKNTYSNDEDEVEVDCIIVTRGGGSFEDLMGFSHPKVIEAIYASKKYTISAVGHEIDNMLSDDVANYRAPTPSIAGAVVSSVNFNNKKKLTCVEANILKIKKDLIQILYKYKKSLKRISNTVIDPSELLNNKLNDLMIRAKSHIKSKLTLYSHRLQTIKEILNSNDVNVLLENGFMMLTNVDNTIVTNAKDMFDKDLVLIHASGRYSVTIKKRDADIQNTSSVNSNRTLTSKSKSSNNMLPIANKKLK